MKPTHWTALAAVLAVAVVVLFLLQLESDPHADRTKGGRTGAGSARSGPAGGLEGEEGGGGARAGKGRGGALEATLKVVDPQGLPAGGAEISFRGRDRFSATADAEGVARLEGLHAGLYSAIATKGRATGSTSFELKRRATDLGTIRLEQAVAIRGRVCDAEGEPIGGALVQAAASDSGNGANITRIVRLMTEPEQVAAEARSEADGRYELLVGSGGTFSLRATARGYAQENEAPRSYAADVEHLDFYLFPGVEVAGRVQDRTGRPIVGAHVLVADWMSIIGRRHPKQESVTGADGRFAFAVSPSEQMAMTVRATGYATHIVNQLKVPSTDLTITLERGVTIRLRTVEKDRGPLPAPGVEVALMYHGGFAAGETDDAGELLLPNLPLESTGAWGNRQNAFLWGGGFVPRKLDLGRREPESGLLDLGDIEMAKGGVVTGKVTDAKSGEGVGGARLRSVGGIDREMELIGATTTLSKEDGTYELIGVPLKATAVMAFHKEYVSPMDLRALFSGMSGGGEPLFAPGETHATKDLVLSPAALVTGVVVGPGGAPVAGAKVRARQDQFAMILAMFGGGVPEAVTDAEGRFALGGVGEGSTIQIYASHREFGSSETVQARGGAGERITLSLAEPITIRGLVVDEKGDPVVSVRVQVQRAERARPGAQYPGFDGDEGAARPAITDEEGKYLVRNAPAGDLALTFSHNRYSQVTQRVSVAGSESHDAGKTVLPRGFGIEGHVVDDEGKPVPNVSVMANLEQQTGPGAQANGRRWGSDRTDKTGRFEIYGLHAGEFELRVWREGSYARRVRVSTGAKDARIVLREAAKLVGVVTGGGGKPVAGANVQAEALRVGQGGKEDTQHVDWAQTDAAGRFVLERLPPDEAIRITIRHDGHRTATFDNVRVGAGDQPFRLERGNWIEGRVVDTANRPAAGARVTVTVDGGHAKSVVASLDGSFTAGGLQEGEIRVQVVAASAMGANYIPTEPVVVASGDRSVRIVVERGESIAGFIVGAQDEGMQRVQVQAIDADGKVAGTDWVWSTDGRFELKGLRKGVYTVRVSTADTVMAEAGTEPTAPGEPRRVDYPDVRTGTKDLKIVFDR